MTLDDDQGFRWATREVEPVDRMYPSWMWSGDEVIRDQVRLEIPPEVPPGRYQLNVKLFDRGRPLPTLDARGLRAGTQAKLIDVDILRSESQPRERDVEIAERKRQKLSDDLEIVGNNLGDAELTAGGSLDLALIWRALRDVPKEYDAHIRIVGSGDKSWGELTVPPPGLRTRPPTGSATTSSGDSIACRSIARRVPARGGWWWSYASAVSSVRSAVLRSGRSRSSLAEPRPREILADGRGSTYPEPPGDRGLGDGGE